MRSGGRLRGKDSRFLGTGGRTGGPGSTGDSHQLAFPPASRGDPRALHVSCTLETPALATSPAPPVGTILLRLVPAVLTRRRRTRTGPHNPSASYSAAVLNQIGVYSLIQHARFLEEMGVLLTLLILPQLNCSSTSSAASSSSAASAPSDRAAKGIVGVVVDGAEARSGGQEGNYADTEGGGGVGSVEGVVVGEEVGVGVVVVVVVVGVVEGGGRGDDEEVAEADHAHLVREAVVDGAGGSGGPHG